MSAPYFIRHLFRPLWDNDGEAIRYDWLGSDREMNLIDLHRSVVCGYMRFDDEHLAYARIYVSINKALHLLIRYSIAGINLRSFPRIGIDLLAMKCNSLQEACDHLMEEMRSLGIVD